jgi:hypothetical protein
MNCGDTKRLRIRSQPRERSKKNKWWRRRNRRRKKRVKMTRKRRSRAQKLSVIRHY